MFFLDPEMDVRVYLVSGEACTGGRLDLKSISIHNRSKKGSAFCLVKRAHMIIRHGCLEAEPFFFKAL